MSDHPNRDDTRRERLEEVIGAFLVALDSGQNPNPAEWLTRHPDLCPKLAEFFADRERLDDLVEPLKVAPPQHAAEPTVSIAAGRSHSSDSSPQTAPGPTEVSRSHAMSSDDGAASIALSQGTRVRYFGDYELQKVLGEGGMGVVYKARQISLNRPVALKMIKAARFASDDDLRRFQNEAEAVARLDHPNIVPIFEVGRFEDQRYFSMKLIGGESLDKRLKDYAADPKRAARLVAVAAAAIHHAHQRGILHRDLKPANILIDPEGQSHVTDFGLAKRVEGDSELTQSGAILGTPAYMAPEQASGTRGVVTTSTDVHELGAILFALLTGRAPFGGATVLDTLEQVRERAPDSPRKLNSRVPRDLDVICLKCLEKDSKRRYASADALAEDLNRWLAGEPIAARRVSNTARLWMWGRRNPWVAGAAGMTAAALVVVVVLSLLYASQQTRHSNEQAEATRKIIGLSISLDRELADTNRRFAMVNFERAKRALDGGQVNHGLLWLVECWRYSAKADDPAWQHLARANLSFWRYSCAEIRGVFSHDAAVDQVAFSPDGKTILTSSRDGIGRLWDAASGVRIGQLVADHRGVASAKFSPDSKWVLTKSSDKTAQLWDTTSGRPVGPPLQHQSGVNAVAFSPDGKIVLTGVDGGTAQLWDAATGLPIGRPLENTGAVSSVVFSPDGRIILTASVDEMARLWDAATAKPIGLPIQLQSYPSAEAFSPDGKTLITAAFGKRARVWDLTTDRCISELNHPEDTVLSIVYSPDGKTVLTRCSSNTSRLWDTSSWLPFGKPLEHQNEVSAVAFGPDGRTVLTGSNDRTARLWDAATGLPIGQPMLHQGWVLSVAFSPDDTAIVTGSSDNTARLWNPARGLPMGQPLEFVNRADRVAFSPDGSKVLTITRSHEVTAARDEDDLPMRLWDARTGLPIGQPIVHWVSVTAEAFGPDGKTILTCDRDSTVRRWDVGTSLPVGPPISLRDTTETQPVDSSMMEQDHIRSWACGPGGTSYLTVHPKTGVRLWDAKSGKLVMQHANAESAAFSPDGKVVLIGHKDNTARMWNPATGLPIGKPMEHKSSVTYVAFSPDGKTILTVSRGSARLWDATTAEPIGQPIVDPQGVYPLAFSPDGRTVLARSGARTLRIWAAATGQPIGQPMVHPESVASVAFSPDGKTILTGAGDNKARLWDAATGQPVGPALPQQGAVISVAYGPDGKTIAIASTVRIGERNGSAARLWHLPALIEDDLPRIKTWIETITGMELDRQGNIDILNSEAWQERRDQLGKLGGPPKADSEWLVDPILYGPEPAPRARTWMERKRWAEAEVAFAEAARARPSHAAILTERGRFFAMRSEPAKAAVDFAHALDLGYRDPKLLSDVADNDAVFDHLVTLLPARARQFRLTRAEHLAKRSQWARANADFREASRLGPLDMWTTSQQVSALVAAGNRDELGRVASSMLNRFGETTVPLDANGLARALVLAPGAVTDPETATRLAEFAVNGSPEDHLRFWVLGTLGAALYRAGRFDDAIRRLEEGIRLARGREDVSCWPFLAMAHHRLGHRDEARRWLDRLCNRQPSTDPHQFWDELQIRLLRSEAEAVILYDPVFPADPFAR